MALCVSSFRHQFHQKVTHQVRAGSHRMMAAPHTAPSQAPPLTPPAPSQAPPLIPPAPSQAPPLTPPVPSQAPPLIPLAHQTIPLSPLVALMVLQRQRPPLPHPLAANRTGLSRPPAGLVVDHTILQTRDQTNNHQVSLERLPILEGLSKV